MFQIGDSLHEARTRRGLSAADVQKAIRIRERYLTALEEERWDMLPGEAYTKGFLRTYAEYLGLDGQLYIDEFNSRFANHAEDQHIVPDSLAPTARRGGFFRTGLVGAIVVIAAVAAVAWKLDGSSTPQTRATPPATPRHHVTAPKATTPKAKPAVSHPSVAVLTATRDDSWVIVRVGGPTGKIVYQGILAQGKTLRYGLKQALWVRMGRPSALDVRVGAKPVAGLPSSPANVLLTRAGAASA
jgi:cytoskeleton protein RodZ